MPSTIVIVLAAEIYQIVFVYLLCFAIVVYGFRFSILAICLIWPIMLPIIYLIGKLMDSKSLKLLKQSDLPGYNGDWFNK